MRAHAPGSLTGLYAPPPPDEPDAPSHGASVAIEDGVTVAVEPADETTVRLEGEPTSVEPVAGVLESLGVAATVDLEPDVPLGHGFGASGAATLATALATDAVYDLGRDRDALVTAAHRAELDAGTGQGDVFIQDRGGLLWSGEGAAIDRRALEGAIEWESTGPIPTESFLADEEFRATAARVGPAHLDALGDTPTLRAFVERSRAYVAETGLAPASVRKTIERVDAAGGAATMALFGETVFAVDAEGALPHRTAVSNAGARLLE